jgi:hypothetical protein
MIPNKYKSLVNLKCKNNNIRYISYRLYNLNYLDISYNDISNICEFYSKLIYLNISNTLITNIPDTYINLSKLECYNTKLEFLPLSLTKLKIIKPKNYMNLHINDYIQYIHNNKIPNNVKTYINDKIGSCSICLTNLSNKNYSNISIIKKCNHYFHKACLFEWFGSKLNCPNCRIELLKKKI